QFKTQKLEDLKVVVFAAGKVRLYDPFYLTRSKKRSFFDGFFGEKLVHQWPERATQPRPDRRAEARLFSPDDFPRQNIFERAFQHVLPRQPAKLQSRRHA